LCRSNRTSPRSARVGRKKSAKIRRTSLVELFDVVDEVDVLLGPVFGVTYVDVVFKLLLGIVGVLSLGELSCARTAAASRSRDIAVPVLRG
jgi:hypothetical protein